MDLGSPKFFQAPSVFPSNAEQPLETNPCLYGKSKGNPFADTFTDPLCKLTLKETSEFVKSLPMAATNVSAEIKGNGFVDVSAERRREGVNSVTAIQRRSMEAPSTPGRPVFSFSSSNPARKTFPSKWDDAQKWLINGSNEFSALPIKPAECSKMPKQCVVFKQQMEVIAEKSRVTEEKASKVVTSFQGSLALDQNEDTAFHGVQGSTDFLLKDKFTDEVESILPHFRSSESFKEGFLFRNSSSEATKDAGTETVHEVKHRDIGTEMTPLGSSTTSQCHTPFKSSSPARHNTPANRSGPLASENNFCNGTIDITKLEECHLAKLQFGTQYDSVTSIWSSREEEEEEVSKSLRHFEINNTCRRSISESRAAAWEEEEKTKCCSRYQREEAKIQAWVDLQNAKAEAQSRKLEVKIQKMRSNLEEKLMKRMAIVHRKAEECRAAAQQQHAEQMQATGHSHKMMNRQNVQVPRHKFCGCFPCHASH